MKRVQEWWTVPDLPATATTVDLGAGGTATPLDPTKARTFLSSDIRRVRDAEGRGIQARVITTFPGITCDRVLYEPTQREAKQRVFERIDGAFRSLSTGGLIYLAGRKNRGVASYARRMERVFGNVTQVGRADRTRVFVSEKRSVTSGEVPVTTQTEFEAPRQGGGVLRFRSEAGVFSADAFDEGSRLLVETISSNPADRILDVGCGCGVIGITLASSDLNCQLTSIDCNAIAVECTRENLAKNDLATRGAAYLGDLYDGVGDEPFDLIVSNPPFHEGNAVSHPLISGALERLCPKGRLVLVVMRPDPYLLALNATFGDARILAADGPYTVLGATKTG